MAVTKKAGDFFDGELAVEKQLNRALIADLIDPFLRAAPHVLAKETVQRATADTEFSRHYLHAITMPGGHKMPV